VHEITRHGYDWAKKYPRVVEAARKPKAKSFLIDGEVVWCGADEASC
jgi:ATP-dependent DNA ligase